MADTKISAELFASALTGAELFPLVQSGANFRETLNAISAYVNSQASTGSADLFWFGDGSDGDLTAASGTTTLTKDTFYNNVTLTGSAIINTAGFRLHVKGILDIEGLTSGHIGRAAINGGNAGSSTQGTSGGQHNAGTLGGANGGAVGGAGTATAGAAGAQGSPASFPAGGQGSSTAGAGGLGPSGAGGAAGAGVSTNASGRVRRPVIDAFRGVSLITGGHSGGAGGGGGGGDGTQFGGGGGAGGTAGGIVQVFARTIRRGASTAASAIRAPGGNGGNGRTQTAGNVGGGGGGSGGSGGWVQVVYRFLTGATALNCIDVSSGAGGNAGLLVGTGSANGVAGGGAYGGFAVAYNLATGVFAANAGPSTIVAGSGLTGAPAISVMLDL